MRHLAWAEADRGLVVRAPWIDLLLSGKKVWEIRGSSTTRRGWVALLRSGAQEITGFAYLAGVVGPLSEDQLRAQVERHQIPPSRLDQVRYTRPHAWVFEDAFALDEPIPYAHPVGAVIWVQLPIEARRAVRAKGLGGRYSQPRF